MDKTIQIGRLQKLRVKAIERDNEKAIKSYDSQIAQLRREIITEAEAELKVPNQEGELNNLPSDTVFLANLTEEEKSLLLNISRSVMNLCRNLAKANKRIKELEAENLAADSIFTELINVCQGWIEKTRKAEKQARIREENLAKVNKELYIKYVNRIEEENAGYARR